MELAPRRCGGGGIGGSSEEEGGKVHGGLEQPNFGDPPSASPLCCCQKCDPRLKTADSGTN